MNARIRWFACLFLWLLPVLPAQPRGDRDAAALQAMQDLADGQNGLVCWQSRRTGSVRIFCCDFDGANLRQVSPDVSSRDQVAPLISPDGTRVLYYQTMMLDFSTYYIDHTGDMYMVDADDTDGSSARELVPGVRTFFECRFARWVDDDRIAYIGGDHDGYIYSISQDASTRLFDYPYDDYGAIPNRQLTYAIDGKNRIFGIRDPGPDTSLTEHRDYGGCEGNMTYDGRFAYRVKDGWPGHHFMKMKLGTWEDWMFFENLNDALPIDQNYQYFPQISPDQRFLALGASRDRSEHNHWDSDYDIFVVPIDAATLQSTGDGVKYSFSDQLDSYPDIWVEADLPTQLLLSPARLSFEAVMGGDNPEPRAVAARNAGGGILQDVSASESSDWLEVVRSGSENWQTLSNSVEITGLSPGTHTATVEVSCPNASNSPQSYTVSLDISEEPPPDGPQPDADGGAGDADGSGEEASDHDSGGDTKTPDGCSGCTQVPAPAGLWLAFLYGIGALRGLRKKRVAGDGDRV